MVRIHANSSTYVRSRFITINAYIYVYIIDFLCYSYPLSPALLCQHEEIEEALESYLTDYSSYESQLEFVKSQIQGAEAQVLMRRDNMLYTQNV